jgi:hypothetical protein
VTDNLNPPSPLFLCYQDVRREKLGHASNLSVIEAEGKRLRADRAMKRRDLRVKLELRQWRL